MPSVVLVRRGTGRRNAARAATLVANVSPLDAGIRKGCIMVVETDRVTCARCRLSGAPRVVSVPAMPIRRAKTKPLR
jgi:hypothetical protein